MKKRLARILAVTLGAATLLTGCGGNSGQKTSDSSKKSDDQKITEDVTKTEGEIEVWTNLSQEEMNFYVEEFNKIVPGVKVKVTVMHPKSTEQNFRMHSVQEQMHQTWQHLRFRILVYIKKQICLRI